MFISAGSGCNDDPFVVVTMIESTVVDMTVGVFELFTNTWVTAILVFAMGIVTAN
jgi:hypothetical protein